MVSALRDFHVLQEVSGERGNRTILARSKGGSVVTVKVLAEGTISDEQSSLLSKEASLGARLTDGAILQTRSMLLEPSFAAVVTEFVPGVSLQRLLRFATGRGVRLPEVCGLYVLERVLAGLAHAHSLQIIHRGVSPSSAVVGWDGTVKLGDFGLVKMRQIATEGTSRAENAREHMPLMSPEEVKGDKPDARSDVYCAALLAIRVLTGRTPFARFLGTPSERTLAMADGNVAHLAQTRPDLAAPLREAIDAALEPDPAKRTTTAEQLLAVVRAHADLAQGKAALAKLMGRWKSGLEASVTPWERRASIPDEVPDEETGLVAPGTLSLAIPDERPSDAAMLGREAPPDEPWKKGGPTVPPEEAALEPTDPVASMSRLGSIAPDALVMPLPPMRITMPELPTYGGPPVNVSLPPPKRGVFTGGVAAAVVATMFIVLIAGAVVLFRSLMSPGH